MESRLTFVVACALFIPIRLWGFPWHLRLHGHDTPFNDVRGQAGPSRFAGTRGTAGEQSS